MRMTMVDIYQQYYTSRRFIYGRTLTDYDWEYFFGHHGGQFCHHAAHVSSDGAT